MTQTRDFDELLGEIGEFGPYQLFVYLLLSVAAIPSAFRINLSPFLTPNVKHRCSVPAVTLAKAGLRGDADDSFVPRNEFMSTLLNDSVPLTYDNASCGWKFAECVAYGPNKTEVPCEVWVFERSSYTATATEDFELVCCWSEWRTYTMMAPMIGLLFGSIVFGDLSDRYGRKRLFIISLVCVIVNDLLCAWAPNLAYFTFYRCMTGALDISIYLTLFVLGIEMVGPSKRVTVGLCIGFFWAIGVSGLAGVAYAVSDWHILHLISALSNVLFIPYIWLLPESPRWLMTKGRHQEGMEVVETIAKYNKTRVPARYYDVTIVDKDAKDVIGGQSSEHLWHLCTDVRLAIRNVVVVVNWVAVTLAYYGLLLHVGTVTRNKYLNFFLGGLVEVPATIICLILLDRIGRRIVLSGSMLLGGIACIFSIFPVVFADTQQCQRDEINIATLLLSLIGRLGVTAGYSILYIFSSELYPTTLRNGAVGFCSMSSRIGGIAAPYIATMNVGGRFGKALPLFVFGVFTTAAGILSLVLPETLRKNLPETLEDARLFGRKPPRADDSELTRVHEI